MGVIEAVKEAIWLQGLLEELGVVQKHVNIYPDSQSAIHLAKYLVYHLPFKENMYPKPFNKIFIYFNIFRMLRDNFIPVIHLSKYFYQLSIRHIESPSILLGNK